MPAYIGSKQINDIALGGNVIDSVYYGRTLVYSRSSFKTILLHDQHDATVSIPRGTYEITLMGSGGQGGGGNGGAGARGQFLKFRIRTTKTLEAVLHLGAPGGLNGTSIGGASNGGSAGGDGASPSWLLISGPEDAIIEYCQYRSSAYDPSDMGDWWEHSFRFGRFVSSVWGGGGGGGQGENGTSGKYLAARDGGAGGGWYCGAQDGVSLDVLATYSNAGGVVFVNNQPQISQFPGKKSGTNGAGEPMWNYNAFGGSGGTSGRDYGSRPIDARTAQIKGTGASGANGATCTDRNHNSSYYGAGGGGAGGGPNGCGGAGGTYTAAHNNGENGYNYRTTPEGVTNPLTGEISTVDWGCGGASGLRNGTWGWIKIERL